MNLLVYSPVVKLFRRKDAEPVSIDPKSFAGGVRSIKVASDVGGVSVQVYRVEFDTGGRTHWHRHTGAQWLLIIGGRVFGQEKGGAGQGGGGRGTGGVGAGGKQTHWGAARPHRAAPPGDPDFTH